MLLLLLFLTGLFAGTVDAIAGGGGLISLPVLLSIGMPPHLAFGTNKLQATLGTMVAALRYHRHGLISLATVYSGVIFGLTGSILGAVASQRLSSDVLGKIIPVLLTVIFIYTLLSPRLGHQDEKPRMTEKLFYPLFGFSLGLYDGFFGPGTGSLWVFLITFFLGYNLIKATAYTKIFNLNSSLIATICFAIGGNIDYRFALCMAAGQMLGGRVGSHLAITKGAKLIRPIFLSVVSITIGSLSYKVYVNSSMYNYLAGQYGLLPQALFGVTLVLGFTFIYLRQQRGRIPN